MFKKSICFLFSLFVFTSPILATHLPNISADGAILIEPKTNTVIYAKNMNQTFYPASTTKILTALEVLNDLPTNFIVTKSQTALNEVPSDSSQIGLAVGDEYTVLNGLYAVLLASDNFVCYDLALSDSGSIPAFADKMNLLAKTNHAFNSNFVNPHGYYDSSHYTTPYDLSQIAIAAFNNPTLEKIAGTLNYKFKVNNTGKIIDLKHTALLLDPKSPYYNPHVVAAKTGYHTPAGRTLVAKAKYNNIELIGVIMHTDAPLQFEDMNKLFKYGSENFSLSTYTNGYRHLINQTYSHWAKPYVMQALEKGWIMNNTHNYTTPINKREFITLLKSATPSEYSSLFNNMIQYNSSSIYNENLNISRQEIAQIIYKFLCKLDLICLPTFKNATVKDLNLVDDKYQEAIKLCINLGIMSADENGNFWPDKPLSYENGLRIASNINSIVTRYDTYGLPLNCLPKIILGHSQK